jgi:hypothetical protein
MFRLRKKNPPFGTVEAPIMEYAYSEQVKVVEGQCDVVHQSTKDFLLKSGYEEILDQEPVAAGVTTSADTSEPVEPRAQRKTSKKHEKKLRR